MADQTVAGGQSVYPLPPGDYGDAGYRYEDAPPHPSAAIPPPPLQQPVYAEQPGDSSPAPAPVPPSATKSKGSGEVKPRLRKACDSYSVRKVKVLHPALPLPIDDSTNEPSSATKAARLASPVPPSRSPVPSIARADGADLPIGMRKPSNVNAWTMDRTTRPLPLTWPLHPPEMLLTVLLRYQGPCHRNCRPR